MLTRQELEAGNGRYTQGKTTILQFGSDDRFETEKAGSGWVVRQGWHIAGSCGKTGEIKWCDLR